MVVGTLCWEHATPATLWDLTSMHCSNVAGSSRGLLASQQVRSGGLQRELIWNRRAGLQPDSAILRNASTARIVVDAQGRRSVSMVNLAIPAGTATGDLQFR